MHSITRFFITSFLMVFLAIVVGGCQQKYFVRPAGVQPFVPLLVEFNGTYRDASVEREIENQLFYRDGLFLRADTTPSPYTLKIEYRRFMDLKSLGLFFLTAALAPIKAEFTYHLQVQLVQLVKDDIVLQEYVYTTQTQENTNSALEQMLYPFHDENGRSEEIFAGLTNSFLRDVLTDKPFPQMTID